MGSKTTSLDPIDFHSIQLEVVNDDRTFIIDKSTFKKISHLGSTEKKSYRVGSTPLTFIAWTKK